MKMTWDYDTSVWANILGWLVGILIVLGLAFGLMCLSGWLIMLVWNATLPAIFGFTTLTFWQAFGLHLLVWLLFGGISKGIVTLLKND
jgi:hypothetical protein